MDFTSIKSLFEMFISLLTKLLVAAGVLEADEDAPFQEYINDLMGIADAAKDAAG